MPKEDDDVQWEESRPALTEQGEDGIIPFKLKSENGTTQDSPPPLHSLSRRQGRQKKLGRLGHSRILWSFPSNTLGQSSLPWCAHSSGLTPLLSWLLVVSKILMVLHCYSKKT